MAFCPMCKCEYKKGIELCPDCKEVLVDSLEQISHAAKEEFDAQQIIQIMNAVEADEEKSDDAKETTGPVKRVGVYRKSADISTDNKYSAYILLSVGILGIIALVLICLDVIPLYSTVTSKVVTGVVMGSLFTVFVVMGIVSLKNAIKFGEKADSESDLTKEIMTYCEENLTASSVDGSICDEEFHRLAEEVKYFKRIDHIRELITRQFMNLEEEYVNYICDEIYVKLYEE